MGSRLGAGSNPGAYFDRADIEGATIVQDAGGGSEETWAAIANGAGVPVAVRALEGTERLRAMQTDADVTHEVETSIYVEGVKASHRLKLTSDGDRILDIVSAPIVIGRKRRLSLLCREEL